LIAKRRERKSAAFLSFIFQGLTGPEKGGDSLRRGKARFSQTLLRYYSNPCPQASPLRDRPWDHLAVARAYAKK
jgi:hypothetical protein